MGGAGEARRQGAALRGRRQGRWGEIDGRWRQRTKKKECERGQHNGERGTRGLPPPPFSFASLPEMNKEE